MATYNKRGYKPAKEKEEKLDNTFIEDTPNVDEKDSTTAKAFDALDQTASKTEEFCCQKPKIHLGFFRSNCCCNYWLFDVPKIHCWSE